MFMDETINWLFGRIKVGKPLHEDRRQMFIKEYGNVNRLRFCLFTLLLKPSFGKKCPCLRFIVKYLNHQALRDWRDFLYINDEKAIWIK